jgi:hypothetical protein
MERKLKTKKVTFFGPMKSAWRKELLSYDEQDPAAKLLQKTEFPIVLRIRIHRIRKFLGLLDPDPFIIKQK